MAEHLKLPGFDHHRAVADAKTLGEIFRISLEKLEKEHGVGDIAEINGIAAGGADFRYMPTYHQTILVRDDAGLKNLYRLISYSHINYFYKKPRILKSLLMQHREGLLIGTACDAGELYTAVMEGKPADELRRIGEFYDYFEIQPIGNTMHLIGEGRVGDVGELKEINRRICDLGEKLGSRSWRPATSIF